MSDETQSPPPGLRQKHRAMWASGDYPSMVETFLLPLGPRLVEACGIGPGQRVLDVAAGTGDLARAFAKQVGSSGLVVHTDINEAMLRQGRHRLIDVGVVLPTVICDAERLPFASETFDLVNGPLWRVRVLRLTPDHHALVLVLHHIICDGWSRGVLVHELGELYTAHHRGHVLRTPLVAAGIVQDRRFHHATSARSERPLIRRDAMSATVRISSS